MAFIIGDSFDWYTTNTDAGAGYWDVGQNFVITTGRFTGSQGIGAGAAVAGILYLQKSSGSNDATHHICVAFQQTVALSGVIAGMTLTLMDGTTAQCSIVFQSSGNILLTSGAGTGTTLATYTSAFSQNVWAGFEFEVSIDSAAGVFRVRKNGNSANDFQATNLATRGGTTNSYANKLQVVYTTNSAPLNGSSTAHVIDDLLWFNTTGTAPNTWVGDVRAYQLLPTSDVSTQFTPSSNPVTITLSGAANGTLSRSTGVAQAIPFVATASGPLTGGAISVNTGGSGHLKLALYDNSSNLLATSTEITNPGAGTISFTFPSPATVTRGTTYRLAYDQDFTIIWNANASGTTAYGFGQAYSGFPANPGVMGSSSSLSVAAPLTVNITPTNSSLVADTQQDGSTTYVYSSTVGQADFYNAADLPGTPASIVAVTTRGYGQKSDAGTRIGQIQMKSGSSTVQTGAAALGTAFAWQSRTDITDPATGQTWTASGVNALQIGPYVGG